MKTKKRTTLSTLAGGVLLILALFRGRVSHLPFDKAAATRQGFSDR